MKKSFLPLFLLLLFLLLIGSLPKILSSSFGKKILLHQLSKKMQQELLIETIHLSWMGPQLLQKIDVKSKNTHLSIEEFSTDLPLWKLLRLSSFSKETFLSLKGKTEIKDGSFTSYQPESHFSNIHLLLLPDEQSPFHLSVTSSSDKGGKIAIDARSKDLDFSAFDASISLKDIPSLLLDQFSLLFTKLPENFFSSLLGPTFQVESHCKIEQKIGAVHFALSSSLTHLQANSRYENGLITLSEDLDAEFYLTETFSHYFLKEVTPLFITAASSKKPIHLTIFKEGFELPLPFSLKEVKVQKALLNLGQMEAKSTDGLGMILGIMKLHIPTHADKMEIWAGPVTLSLYDGTIYSDRMDALLDQSLHICTWGNIDLLTKDVDMTLGFTADTLQDTFRLSNLPEDYVLTIPVKGTIDNVKIDSSVASAKIAKLMALKATNAGGLNKLFGGIIKEENVPPPKRPYPWEGKGLKSSSEKTPLDKLFDLFQ